jgi:hypothetical protein
MKAVGSHLTYANVMATVAVFLALGGGAYALSGIPDRSGVYHGCVNPKAGALRVVKAASSCRKTKTVRRGTRRVRIPGESAIAWNQQGRPGIQGIQGLQGLQGNQGPPGPTAGFASTDLGTPPSGFTHALALVDFTTPTSGKLFVSGHAHGILNCNGACAGDWGLYVDGVPVPGSDRHLSLNATGSTDTQLVIDGVVAGVSSGPHTLVLGNKGTSGNAGFAQADAQVSAMLLGG